MPMSLREMHETYNHGSLRQIQEAMGRTEFFQFMQKGVKGLLVDAYQKALRDTTFEEITVLDPSTSDGEDYPSMGGPQLPKKKLEGMPYQQLNGGSPDSIRVTNATYGGIIALTKEADKDDQTPGKALRKQASQVGPNHAKLKDKFFYSLLTGNPTIYDGGTFFRLNHPGYTGGANRASNDNAYTGVTMSANALQVVLGIIAQWEGADPDQDLDVMPERIVAPITMQQTAHGLINADLLPFAMAAGVLGPGATVSGGMPNRMKGKLALTTSHRLDRVSTTDWYVKTNFPGLLYQPREGLTVMAEAPNAGRSFENRELRWLTDERFGGATINWRWGVYVS